MAIDPNFYYTVIQNTERATVDRHYREKSTLIICIRFQLN